jgi:hypothetical protein
LSFGEKNKDARDERIALFIPRIFVLAQLTPALTENRA